jgi:hypothetical protein
MKHEHGEWMLLSYNEHWMKQRNTVFREPLWLSTLAIPQVCFILCCCIWTRLCWYHLWRRLYVTEQVHIAVTRDLYRGCLVWIRLFNILTKAFVVFLSLTTLIPWQYLEIGHGCLLPNFYLCTIYVDCLKTFDTVASFL